ncbi:hypothetical protein EW146_g3329 [Bondarzewia mesenterica]|uniref:Beta-hexosaminidase n=1 Tax=Bondarzewia mesenterica TaxID=1095465 RepID=A0A4S4LXX5_9AGAM|nr:hypothetical protein EW146_g3329 [Bondarzewia mesenterica]
MTLLHPLILFIFILTAPFVGALWPLPRNMQTGSTALRLADDFDIKFSLAHASSDLRDAVSRTMSFLRTDKLERLVVGRGATDGQIVTKAKSLSSLTLTLLSDEPTRSIYEEAIAPLGDRDEHYNLRIPDDESSATLTANSMLGLFRGLTTFAQLWYYYNGHVYMLEAPLEIDDLPAFPYRGLMLDTCRNFFPVDDIKRTLDAMSWVKSKLIPLKMSVFHWHIVDSQSFPLQVPDFEEISQRGAYSPNYIYSPSDVEDIVLYAGMRGIDVVVEIDTPGHTAIISESHPEHVACPQFTPWSEFANEPPAGQLRLTSFTTNFTVALLSSIVKLFPSTMFSAGGDEVNMNCYAQDQEMRDYLNSSGQTLNDALSNFVQNIQAMLIGEGKTPLISEEMILENDLNVSNNTIVLVWMSSTHVPAVTKKGLRVVFAASDYVFLDCGAGAWVGNDVDGISWCDPLKTWQKTYSVNPLANLTEEESKMVIGGQHLLWTEQSSSSNLDPITWPRAASAAEVFWSGPGGNVSTVLPRLHDMAYRMVQRGVRAIPLQPQWCALRPGACDLTH